ncbi:RrF2 family transcriptional regulator [Nonomuraea sp. SYSU D8015]|uniref:RrF2 family transcriptional regulator n=1 Tax=Nonomuraea sp. SYSU D8015 TaxID=2593644 RepID=UPI001CB728F6|nr:Rrf2 family transcriptional regulator [Nonomuraea sp. SYSU D8015]
MSEGVEWVLHTCVNLSWIGRPVRSARLAAFYDLPPAYLNKQLQALVRAGILTSVSGPKGGFALAREPASITLLEVVTAIEGADPAFRCAGILGDSPWGDTSTDYVATCVISTAMRKAELAWREELAGQTVADVCASVERRAPGEPERTRRWFG